ncbi:MAG: hypothetical protein ACK53H_04940 [Betaproteobacteria bacterium]|nr:DUF2845 domain-containing protein [Betaproteobacteria bacterium]
MNPDRHGAGGRAGTWSGALGPAQALHATCLCVALLALPAAAWSQPSAGSTPAPAAPRNAPGSDLQPLTAQPLPPAASGSGRGNEVFRSVDDNGTPSFSQVPPSGRASKPVDLKPLSGSIDSARPAVQPRAQPAAPAPVAAPPAGPPVAAGTDPAPRAGGPRGLPFETYILIRRGMSEGELLGRAGPPDHRGNEINRGLVQESWYYLPTPNDPFTTIIQMRGGRVVDTERIRKL